ncbi:MAG TPA: hypothetical protein VL422_00945 [Miltoncostaea sp.]|jgi:hypothetical protein|nr:hypothetical protein [Miltoncostaea sp.]
MAIDQTSDAERVVEISLRMAPTPRLSTIGRVVREEPGADARPRGRVVHERVRPGVLMTFGCVVREEAARDGYALGRIVREPHP